MISPLTEEEFLIAKELFDTYIKAYPKVAVPFIVFDREEVKRDIEKSRDLLEKLV